MPINPVLAVRELGLRPLTRFAAYQLGMKSGWYRLKTPTVAWDDISLKSILRSGVPSTQGEYLAYRAENRPQFFFSEGDELKDDLIEALQGRLGRGIREAEEIAQGRFRLFRAEAVRLGLPPVWGMSAPLVGQPVTVPLDQHWSSYDLDSFPVDIKLVWEVARFGWIYPLCRADVISGKDRYLDTFWTLFSSWIDRNPPNLGIHWFSAQEVAIRLLAIIFANYSFYGTLSLDDSRQGIITKVVDVSAKRIMTTTSYAQAQGNNHLLVEAVALYTAGLLYPELKKSARWKSAGRKLTQQALRDQVFVDGGYVQHSMNYQRLALQAGLWITRLAAIHHEDLAEDVLENIERMASLLKNFVDPDCGRVPNYGPNDGALLCPWSTQPFQDYRPTLQAASVLLESRRRYEAGPWDEMVVWLGLAGRDVTESDEELLEREGSPFALPGETEKEPDAFPKAGLHILRGKRSWGVLRATSFENRPGHSDQLHFDLWWKGTNLLIDPGSYLYNAAPPWENPLALARYHNTVIVNNREPMIRAGKFLWLGWKDASILGWWKSSTHRSEILFAHHLGSEELGIVHQRTILRKGDDEWIIVDDILGEDEYEIRLSWMLAHLPWRQVGCGIEVEIKGEKALLEVEAEDCRMGIYTAGALVAGEELGEHDPVLGWYSPTYATKAPSLQLIAHVYQQLPLRLVTKVSLSPDEGSAGELKWNSVDFGIPAISQLTFEDGLLETTDEYSIDSSSLRRNW